MLEDKMMVNDVAVAFDVHRTTIWMLAHVSRPLTQLRIGQDPVGQNVPLLEKNVTSGSQQVVTAYHQQVLSTEYGEELESVYPCKQSAIHLKLKACRFKSRG